VAGNLWENKPSFRLDLNKAASDKIACHCKHFTERAFLKFYESGAAHAQDMGVPVSKMKALLFKAVGVQVIARVRVSELIWSVRVCSGCIYEKGGAMF